MSLKPSPILKVDVWTSPLSLNVSSTWVLAGLLAMFAIGLVLLRPLAPMSIDEVIYAHMAAAMWEQGTFHLDRIADPEHAGAMRMFLTQSVNGHTYPEYPAGYALVASPFYGLFGLRGLILLNGLAFIAVIGLTLRIGRQMYGDGLEGPFATAIIGVFGFAICYVGAIWPHMLTLALVLWACERASNHVARQADARLVDLVFAGVILGLAVTIRIESIIVAAALAIWIAFFGDPHRRLAPSAFCIGLLPGLLIASWFNWIKFESFSPLSYGRDGGSADISTYLAPIALLFGLFILGSLVDPTKGYVGRFSGIVQRALSRLTLLQGIALSVLIVVTPLLLSAGRTLFWNMYVLVVDLQQMKVHAGNPAFSYDAHGFLVYAGVYKKALLQSMPILGLVAAAFVGLLRAERVQARTLSLGIIASVFLFYAIRQWHGGFSYNMRYFLICLPFLSLLAADIAGPFLRTLSRPNRQIVVIAPLGLLVALLVLSAVGLPDPFVQFYLPLVFATVLAIIGTWVVLRPTEIERLRSTGLAVGSAALFLTGLQSWNDWAAQSQRVRVQADAMQSGLVTQLPPGSLVVTQFEPFFLTPSLKGITLANPRALAAGVDVTLETARRFELEDRCVYLHAFGDGPENIVELRAVQGGWSADAMSGQIGRLHWRSNQTVDCALTSRE